MTSGVPVEAKGLEGAVQAVCGDMRTCALLESGKIYCWGDQAATRERKGYVPALIAIDGEVAMSASMGMDFVRLECVLTRAGAVYCWGDNDVGQLGIGRRGNATTPQLVVSSLAELKPRPPPRPVTPLSAPPVKVSTTAPFSRDSKGGSQVSS